MSNFRLRAHHAVCLHFFSGKGYSNQFVDNMDQVLESLAKNPFLTIIDYGDGICSKCPNYSGEKCSQQKKVNEYDSKVLQYCSIEAGNTMYWKEFQDIVYKNIIAVNKREMICKDCEWNEICK